MVNEVLVCVVQHYMKMHAPKRYSCVACRASFGLYRDLTRHEKCCRRRILCATCNVAFSTQAELKRHCQLLEHEELVLSVVDFPGGLILMPTMRALQDWV